MLRAVKAGAAAVFLMGGSDQTLAMAEAIEARDIAARLPGRVGPHQPAPQ